MKVKTAKYATCVTELGTARGIETLRLIIKSPLLRHRVPHK